MRIAMVSEHASPLTPPGGPDAGGQNVHVDHLGRALADRGHEVTVWTRKDDPGLPDAVPHAPGVTVRHVAAGPARPVPKDQLVPHLPEFARTLRRAWTTDPPDVVHAHFWMSGLVALSAAEDRDIPVVQTFHALGHVKRRHQGAEDSSPAGRISAERVIATRADRVLATCTDEMFELARLGAPRRRIRIIPCGVDTEIFTPQGTASPRGERPRLLAVGRLVRRKGVDEIIEALRGVPGAELVVAGGAPRATLGSDPDAVRLRERAVRARVADRVEFLGTVPRAEMPALLRSADVVVCVPWYEPFGMVPLEAMACGRAVVAGAVGGMADTVVDQVTGLHVPPRRPRELAVTLRHLLRNPAMLEAFGTAGRDRALARYDWSRIAAATADNYEQVLTARAGQGARQMAEARR
ncbi:glycosyltransferase [Pseudonocardia asaccharolytica]|uniref:Glycosyl transferase n=1 Tax=Pseudonocardia asaccharolytica DSM 44247 = NBRC 16224 TaxID=1123024 RepID=A0A511D338_9PSEU|nr:glycosyltransferase [Pseudonocardia asaccharolytica]GEL17318.1 glycosyl transferase [Pseudonocardia asaccharolytica DSM 44247 = NBRC 16224]